MRDKVELIKDLKNQPCIEKFKDLLNILIEEERNVLETSAQSEINFTQGKIRGYRKIIRLLTKEVGEKE